MDVLPDLSKKQADLILWTIFDSIVPGIKRDGFVKIDGFGRFFFQKKRARYVPHVTGGVNNHYLGVRWRPETNKLAFRISEPLRRSVSDADSGTE